MWWEEIVVAVKVDLADDTQDTRDLARHLGIGFEGARQRTRCPAVAFFPRKATLDTFDVWSMSAEDDPSHSEFRTWVWQRLRMTVSVRNRTPWTLHQW